MISFTAVANVLSSRKTNTVPIAMSRIEEPNISASEVNREFPTVCPEQGWDKIVSGVLVLFVPNYSNLYSRASERSSESGVKQRWLRGFLIC